MVMFSSSPHRTIAVAGSMLGISACGTLAASAGALAANLGLATIAQSLDTAIVAGLHAQMPRSMGEVLAVALD